MSRLSLLMGLFMATTITGIIMLLAVLGNVGASTIISRGIVIFFIFGMLGTILGSFLEVILMPMTTEKESEQLKKELALEDDELKAELGDLLDEDKGSRKRSETFGTPTDEAWSNDIEERYSRNGTSSEGNSTAIS